MERTVLGLVGYVAIAVVLSACGSGGGLTSGDAGHPDAGHPDAGRPDGPASDASRDSSAGPDARRPRDAQPPADADSGEDVRSGDAGGMPSGPLVRFSNDDPFFPLLPPVGVPHLWTPARGSIFKTGPKSYWMMAETEDWYSETHSLGYSTSDDGLVWSDPQIVMGPTLSWENDIWGGPIRLEKGIYKMWYEARSAGSPNKGRTGYATSSDLIHWTKNPTPILDVDPSPSWDDNRCFASDIYTTPTGYRLYVMGANETAWSTGIATSPDGMTWTKASSNPLPVPRDFATVVYDEPSGRWYSWYNAGLDASSGYTAINFAWSMDGLSWTDGPSNPVLTTNTDSNAYDSNGFNGALIALRDGNVYRVFYAGLKALVPALGQWPEYELMGQVNADGSPTVPPTVATAAKVGATSPTTAALSVLGADVGGEPGLIYTWSAFQRPPGAALPTFSDNVTNSAKNTTATFSKPGSYRMRAIVTNPTTNLSAGSDVTVSVGTYEETAPTLVNDASASSASLSVGSTLSLSVLGADSAGEGTLKYYWSATYSSPFTVQYSDNGTNTAKSTTATFTQSGTYGFQCFVVNSVGLDVLSKVVTVVVK